MCNIVIAALEHGAPRGGMYHLQLFFWRNIYLQTIFTHNIIVWNPWLLTCDFYDWYPRWTMPMPSIHDIHFLRPISMIHIICTWCSWCIMLTSGIHVTQYFRSGIHDAQYLLTGISMIHNNNVCYPWYTMSGSRLWCKSYYNYERKANLYIT